MARIMYKGKYGFINGSGKVVIKPQYDKVGFFEDDIVYVKKNKKAGYLDKKGKVIMELNYN